MLDLGNLGHHLGDSKKDSDSGQQECCPPDGLTDGSAGIRLQRVILFSNPPAGLSFGGFPVGRFLLRSRSGRARQLIDGKGIFGSSAIGGLEYAL